MPAVERMLSMWGLGMALVTTAFICAVAARQSWLIATNGGLLLVAFAQGGIGGWLDKLQATAPWMVRPPCVDCRRLVAVSQPSPFPAKSGGDCKRCLAALTKQEAQP